MTAPLRVLIVDDEPLARDNVRLALAADAGVEVVAECDDGDAAVAAIAALRPDLVFLDVQMPGLDGFGVIEAVGPERMPAVVFVTAYDAHALRAFEVHALDYLLKPFDDARVRDAIARARRATPGDALEERLAALLEQAARRGRGGGPLGGYLSRFVVRHGDRAALVRAADVDWIAADGNYAVLHARGVAHRLRVSLRTLAEQLDPRQFARIHKSTIVNLDRVRELQPWFGGDYVAILHDGKQLRVSRSFAAGVLRPLQ